MEKEERVNFDDYAKNYDTILKKQLRFFDNNTDYFAAYKAEKAAQLITQPPRNILDFGCGTGRSTFFLKYYFPDAKVIGVDPSHESLYEAKKQVPLATFLPLDDFLQGAQPFDLIFLAGVLHHIPPKERETTLQSLFHHTSPGGSILVFEHNPYNPLTRYLVNTCPFDQDAILIKPAELSSRLNCAGFSNIKHEYTLFFPGILKRLRPIEPYLKYLPLGGQYLMRGQRHT